MSMFRFSVALTPSPLAPRKIFDFPGNPPDPLPLEGKGEVVLRGGFAPSFLFLPLAFQERGTKRVPRKIEDFSGCFKGVRCRKLRCH